MLLLLIMAPVTGMGIWWNRGGKKEREREKIETYAYIPCVTLRLIHD